MSMQANIVPSSSSLLLAAEMLFSWMVVRSNGAESPSACSLSPVMVFGSGRSEWMASCVLWPGSCVRKTVEPPKVSLKRPNIPSPIARLFWESSGLFSLLASDSFLFLANLPRFFKLNSLLLIDN
ncbi:hypothetical protein B0H21DRAFT_731720 [Amylocystis lapponica]|nr:hypothetical protein B0H21DRAFT_731720 [Amylocystis lapponica]